MDMSSKDTIRDNGCAILQEFLMNKNGPNNQGPFYGTYWTNGRLKVIL